MKILNKKEINYASGGVANQEAIQLQNGYLTSTLHIPPHAQPLVLEILFELPSDLIRHVQS